MQVISDYFQDTAYRLGYKPEDLLPITREAVQAEAAAFTKGMGEKERDYYINKKIVSLMQRQNKIIAQVQRQIKKKELSYKVSPNGSSKLHNPAIVRLLNDHQKIIQKNIKFLDTLQRRKELDERRQQRLSVSSNSNTRKNDRDVASNHSSISRRSNKSVQSSQSNRSSASTKERLMLVRSREKEKEKLIRELYKQREQQNSRKSLKAEEEALRKSQRVRTRSQINKQIVEENRKDIRFLQNTEIKDHFERLKFKLQKTEQIRAKNAERREERSRHIDHLELKRKAQNTGQKELAHRYDDKLRTASMRIENHHVLRQEARNYQRLTQDLKTTNVKKNREQMAKQQKEFADAVRKNEEQRLRTAELNRYSFNGETRLRQIGREVRYEVTRKNAEDLKARRSLESEEVQRKISKKFQQLNELHTVKQKLGQERGHVIRQLNLQRRTLDARNEKPKFNSFFDI